MFICNVECFICKSHFHAVCPNTSAEEQDGANDVKSKLHCAVWNVCSLNNKVNDVMEHLFDHHADIAFITET